jgi:hypothetical protein
MTRAGQDLVLTAPVSGRVDPTGGEKMCFERRDRDEELSRGRRPTSEDIRQLFERYRRPLRVGEDASAEAESTGLNGQAERPETVTRSTSDEPVGMR